MALYRPIPSSESFAGYGYVFKNDQGSPSKTAIAYNTNYTAGDLGVVAFPAEACKVQKVSGASGFTLVHNGATSWVNDLNPHDIDKGDFIYSGGGSTYLTFKFTTA